MASLFGKQTFLNADNSENTVFYKFADKTSLQAWQNSDISCYQANYPDHLMRQKVSELNYTYHITNGGRFIDFSKKEKFSYRNIKTKASYVHINHPNQKYDSDFGVVIKFDAPEVKIDFLKNKGGHHYLKSMMYLKPSDKRVIAANAHSLFLTISKDMDKPADKVDCALKNYPQLNPAKKHLVYLSQKDKSKPLVLSFNSRIERSQFMSIALDNINSKNLPISMTIGKNFNAVILDHAAKGKILEGDMVKHFSHVKNYIQLNNQKDLSSSEHKHHKISQKEFDKRLLLCKTDFKNLDMRGIKIRNPLNGCDFSGSTFKDSNLSNVCLVGIKGNNIDFSNCNLSGTQFQRAKLYKPIFQNTSSSVMYPVNFYNATLKDPDFKFSDHTGAYMRDSNITMGNFYKTTFDSAKFTGAKFQGTVFKNSNLRHSSFLGANFQDTKFHNSDLADSNFIGTKFDENLFQVSNTSFKNSNLKGSTLQGSNFDVTKQVPTQSTSTISKITQKQFDQKISDGIYDFKNLDLRHINLNVSGPGHHKHTFAYCDFSNSSFAGKDLSNVSFRAIKGKNIDFSGTNLTGTSFTNANLDHPNFKASFSEYDYRSKNPLDFKHANLNAPDFCRSDHEGTVFWGCKFEKGNFNNATLNKSNFLNTKISGVLFHDTSLEKTSFVADINELKSSSFKNCNLKNSNLIKLEGLNKTTVPKLKPKTSLSL